MNHVTASTEYPRKGSFFATIARGFEDDDVAVDGYYAGFDLPDAAPEHWLVRAGDGPVAGASGASGWSRGLVTAALGAGETARERLTVVEGVDGGARQNAPRPGASWPSRRPHPAFAVHEDMPRGWGPR